MGTTKPKEVVKGLQQIEGTEKQIGSEMQNISNNINDAHKKLFECMNSLGQLFGKYKNLVFRIDEYSTFSVPSYLQRVYYEISSMNTSCLSTIASIHSEEIITAKAKQEIIANLKEVNKGWQEPSSSYGMNPATQLQEIESIKAGVAAQVRNQAQIEAIITAYTARSEAAVREVDNILRIISRAAQLDAMQKNDILKQLKQTRAKIVSADKDFIRGLKGLLKLKKIEKSLAQELQTCEQKEKAGYLIPRWKNKRTGAARGLSRL